MSCKNCAQWQTVCVGNNFGQVLDFFEKRTLEEGARGLLPVPVPKCKEP